MSPTFPRPPDPRLELGRLIAGELGRRHMSPVKLAAIIGMKERTLRHRLAGEYPFTPDEARSILDALGGPAGFLDAEAAESLVIRAGRNMPDPGMTGASVPLLRLAVDTVGLVFEPDAAEVQDAKELVKRHLPTSFSVIGDQRWHYERDGMLASWDRDPESRQWSTLRVQLAPWNPEHRRTLQALVSGVPSLWGDSLGSPARFMFSRVDYACDYRASPDWLLVHRPKALRDRRTDSGDGSTRYSGGRGRGCSPIRLYNGSHRHPDDQLSAGGAWSRLEAEMRFDRRTRADELPNALFEADPFPNTGVALLPGTRLLPEEIGHVMVVRELGAPYVRTQHGAKSAEWLRISKTLAKLTRGPQRVLTPGRLPEAERRAFWAEVSASILYALGADPDREAEPGVVPPPASSLPGKPARPKGRTILEARRA